MPGARGGGGSGSGSGVILAWQANHAYAAGEAMTQSGATYTRNSAGTSRATFDSTELALWTLLPTGGFIIENVNTVATAGASQTLPDVTVASIHNLTLTAATCTLTFPTAAAGKSFTVVVNQDSTGSRLVAWPTSVLWPSNTSPTLGTAASALDVFTFLCVDGTTWVAFEPTPTLRPALYRSTVLADSPISYWRLGEASGTAAADEMGVNAGTYTSVTLGATSALTSEPTNKAVTFNGTTSKAQVKAGQIISGLTNWTIEAWAKTTVGDKPIYCERGSSGNDIVKLTLTASSTLQLTYRDHAGTLNQPSSSGMSGIDGNYHHIVVTKSGTAIVFYVNGAQVSTGTLTAGNTFGEATAVSLIGADVTGNEFFNGTIDELAVYGTALSSARVAAHYAAA